MEYKTKWRYHKEGLYIHESSVMEMFDVMVAVASTPEAKTSILDCKEQVMNELGKLNAEIQLHLMGIEKIPDAIENPDGNKT